MNNNLMNLNNLSDTELEIIHKQSTTVQITRLREKIESLVIDSQKQQERMNVIEGKVDKRMTIDYGQQQAILNAKNSRVEKLWADGNVNKTVHDTKKKVHGSAWKDLKNAFGVSSYRDIKEKDFEEALNYVKSWRPKIV